MGRVTSYVSLPGFVADSSSITRNPGVQIDWDSVSATRENSAGKKEIAAGTIMAKVTDGWIPRLDVSGTEVSGCILETTAVEDDLTAAKSGYGGIIGGVIYSNLLAETDETDFATWLAELNDTGVGTGFAWQTYADDREV